MVFKPGDWVWVHFRKISFPGKAKSKLDPRGDGPFVVLERVNDNAYVIDLSGEYNVSCTFNVADLSLFDVGDDPDLRTNPSLEGEDDKINASKAAGGNSLRDLGRSLIRAMARRKQEGVAALVKELLNEEGTWRGCKEGVWVVTWLKMDPKGG